MRGVFSTCVHMNFIWIWVWDHFGLYFTLVKLTEMKFSNRCEIPCEHIFTWSEFCTLNEMKLWRNLMGQFKITSVHTPKMKCSCEQRKNFQNFPATEKRSEFQTDLKFSCEHTLIVHSPWLYTNYFYFNDSIDIFCSCIMLEKVNSYLTLTLLSELY